MPSGFNKSLEDGSLTSTSDAYWMNGEWTKVDDGSNALSISISDNLFEMVETRQVWLLGDDSVRFPTRCTLKIASEKFAAFKTAANDDSFMLVYKIKTIMLTDGHIPNDPDCDQYIRNVRAKMDKGEDKLTIDIKRLNENRMNLNNTGEWEKASE